MAFEHQVDKSLIPTVNILGVDVAAIDMTWLLRFTKENIKKLSGDYMTVANVHTTVTASEDEAYRAIQNGGILAMPDGGPLSAVGRKRGAAGMERTTGPDFMERIFQSGDYSHFFLGSTPETLEKMQQRLAFEYPGIDIHGMYSPPFREMTEDEDRETVERINAADAEIVWVGLGAPKQERWMAAHQGRVKGLMVGVGAGFDYFAGNIRRAPEWMQKANLEWLYRLAQDPRRLFKRYLVTNTKFMWDAVMRGK